ncbi:MAG: polysaccharide biosynthesis protein PslG [Thermoleophilaceae bacterium]|nr:polysaccharide biosynthesis protein PslG [Thermoleophilaceae bacterium]
MRRVNRPSRLFLALTMAALVAATMAAPAGAAKRKVPFGFFAAVVPPELSGPGVVSDTVLDQQMALMARSGVEAVRLTFAWEDLESSKGNYNYGTVDRLVRAAAAHRLQVLLNVTQTPRWATSKPDGDWWRAPPKDPQTFGAMIGAFARRYGPTGTFWAENPTLHRQPIRSWQIWNEENAPWHWSTRPWAPSYTKLLKSAYQSIKAVDRGATVVAGSFVAAPNYSQWAGVRDLYRAGGKRWFDQIAVHPFTNNKLSVDGTADQMLQIVSNVRAETRKAHDGRVPIIITELSWPASVGKIPKRALLGLETTPKGQNARLKAGYTRLVKQRGRLGVKQAYWYTWASQYDRDGADSVMSFRYAGLVRVRNGVFSPMPILRTYTSLARKYEGCRKGTDTRCL